MLVEEVPKSTNANTSTVYFSSSINLTARSLGRSDASGESATSSGTNKKGRAKVNYNLNQLMNAQISTNEPTNSGPSKSAQQVQLERLVSKRLVELNHETSTKGLELPKNFTYTSIHATSNGDKKFSQKSRLGNTPNTKRILAARRNLNSYFEEERNLMSVNTILGLNYQFVDFTNVENKKKKRKVEGIRPKIRLCCICGDKSNYSRCPSCGLFYCSVKCNKLHQESRCA